MAGATFGRMSPLVMIEVIVDALIFGDILE